MSANFLCSHRVTFDLELNLLYFQTAVSQCWWRQRFLCPVCRSSTAGRRQQWLYQSVLRNGVAHSASEGVDNTSCSSALQKGWSLSESSPERKQTKLHSRVVLTVRGIPGKGARNNHFSPGWPIRKQWHRHVKERRDREAHIPPWMATVLIYRPDPEPTRQASAPAIAHCIDLTHLCILLHFWFTYCVCFWGFVVVV